MITIDGRRSAQYLTSRLEKIHQDVPRLYKIFPRHQKANRYVTRQVKILTLGEIRNFFCVKNRFNKWNLSCVGNT